MVKKEKLPVRWDRKAVEDLNLIYDYIAKDSVQSAKKVKRELIKLAKSLNYFPEKFPKEPLLKDEIGNYRSIIKWSYKLIYEVTEREIIIAYIFHTSQDPKKLEKE